MIEKAAPKTEITEADKTATAATEAADAANGSLIMILMTNYDQH